jgi:ribosomal protein S6--L-glutamate ligase
MHIGILLCGAAGTELPGAAQLLEAAKRRGHIAAHFFESLITIREENGAIALWYEGAPLSPLDVVIPRPSFVEEPSLHTVTIDGLLAVGYRVINGKHKLASSKNKLVQKVALVNASVPTPHFGIVRDPLSAQKLVDDIGFPLVLKVAFGRGGKGVFFAANMETFLPLVEYLLIRDRNPLIVETFVAEANRSDLRVFVVGGNIVAAMERHAKEGDIRANIHTGGTGTPVTLSQAERELAIQAARALGLDIAGVDIIRSNNGPLVLEVNANPGFEALSNVTQIDVADAMIAFAEVPEGRTPDV